MDRENVFQRSIKFISAKLFKINDSPQRIALGMGVGAFCGMMPGAGPVAALFLAFIFKANRAAALFGSLLINGWISIVTFALVIKCGSAILNLNGQEVQQKVNFLLKDFSWERLFKLSFNDIILPVVVGYLIIALILGVLFYLITFYIVRRNFHGSKKSYP